MKGLYVKMCKTLLKETEDTRKWKDILCSCTGRINIVKMPILPKATYSFSAVPIKIPTPFSPQIQKKNPKISIELQRSQVGKAILR